MSTYPLRFLHLARRPVHRAPESQDVDSRPGPRSGGWSWQQGLARGAWLAWAGTVRMGFSLVLGLLLWGLWQAMLAAPARLRADVIRLALDPGHHAVLGQHELAAPQAAGQHVYVARVDADRWVLRNLAAAHGAEVRLLGRDRPVRAQALQAGDVLQLGSAVLHVVAADPRLELRREGVDRLWSFDGAVLREGQAPGASRVTAACEQGSVGARLRRYWNRWTPSLMAMPTAMTLGGDADCGEQLGVNGLPAGSVWIDWRDGQYWLRATHDSARRVCVSRSPLPHGCAETSTLFEATVDLSQVQKLWVGRSGFSVRLSEDRSVLELRPVGRAGWLPDVGQVGSGMASESASGLSVAAHRHDVWRTPAMPNPKALWPDQVGWLGAAATSPMWTPATAGLVVAAVAAGWARRRGWGLGWPDAAAMGLGLAMAALSGTGYWLGESLGEAWRLVLLSAGCAAVLLLPLRMGWAWVAVLTMTAMGLVGTLLQMVLGLQGQDSGAWGYFSKTASLMAASLWGLWAWAWWLRGLNRVAGHWHWPSMARLEAWISLPVAVALASLALQTVVGSEEGVFGVQPVELAKFALVLLGAHALALRLEWAHHRGWHRWRLWLRFLAPAMLFMAIVALALGLLRDFSPLVLVAAWATGALLAWSVAAGSAGAFALALGALGCAFGAFVWMTHPEGLAWLQAHGFYADRFQVLVDLPRHPHSGEQVHRALQLASLGGADGRPDVAAWRVPAIQDDMLPALLLGRFGHRAGLVLWGLQLLHLFSMAALGWQALRLAGPGDHRRRWLLRMGFFASWGAVALLGGHLLLSWGTVTSALPVMGQPQPLISAGGSIIVLLIAPLHMVWLTMAAALEDRRVQKVETDLRQ